MSCGPACVAMTEGQYKQMCMIDPEGRARQLSQNYPERFTATGGTGAVNLAYVLNAEGVRHGKPTAFRQHVSLIISTRIAPNAHRSSHIFHGRAAAVTSRF